MLGLAGKIQRKLESVLDEIQSQVPGQRSKGHTDRRWQGQVEHILTYVRQFEATGEYFRRAVEKKHQLYMDVHHFFLTAVKVTFLLHPTQFPPISIYPNEMVIFNSR